MNSFEIENAMGLGDEPAVAPARFRHPIGLRKILAPTDLTPGLARNGKAGVKAEQAGKLAGGSLGRRGWSRQRRALLRLRDAVMKRIHELAAEAREENPSYSLHMADAATDTIDRDVFLGLVSFEQEVLYEIDAALRRIEERTYGLCELTGRPIPAARLAAIPWTRFALSAQKEIEGSCHPHIGALGRIRFERQEQPELE